MQTSNGHYTLTWDSVIVLRLAS